MKQLLATLTALPLAVGCVAADPFEGEGVKTEDGKDDASSVALFVDFTFDGEMLSDSSWNATKQVEDHLLYTIGQLNGANSVGRLDKLVLTDVRTESVTGGTRITYHASMPVAWGDKQNVPESFTLVLPARASWSALETFATDYGHDCVDFGAHDVDAGSMWYYFRPTRSGCTFADGDVTRTEAAITVSEINTTGKYPEYQKVWEDDRLEVVAVFGKYEDGATSGDAGIDAYNTFVRSMKTELNRYAPTTIPATVPSYPGTGTPDVEFTASIGGGKTVHVVAVLVDNVREALNTNAFRDRYEALSTRADFIVYNGHAGLGANIRALASNGAWVAGQYVIMFMNGCDTYAYVDSGLGDAHQEINPDDTTGHKYVDIVTNAMPSFFANMAGATMSMFRGLMKLDDPQTYEQIFRNVDRSQVVLVSGEQDNVFQPGGVVEPPAPTWGGLADAGTIARNAEKRFETPTLPTGSYLFTMTGTSDADLYVRTATAPTTTSFDCRPFKTGSNETCRVTLTAPAKLHVMVRGWAASSTYDLTGAKE
jgi:hypothetical protein